MPPGLSPYDYDNDDDDAVSVDDDADVDHDYVDDDNRLTRPMTRMEMMIPFQLRGSGLDATNSWGKFSFLNLAQNPQNMLYFLIKRFELSYCGLLFLS